MLISIRRVAFVLLPLAATLLASADDKPLSVDQIVAKNAEARGGLDKIKAIQSVRMTGNIDISGQMQAPLTLNTKRPNMSRMDLDVNGQSVIQATDGATAWMVNPFTGAEDPQKMPDDEAKAFNERADIDGPLVDYKAKGSTVELQGTEDVSGSPAYKLKITSKSGSVQYLYVDAKTFLDSKSTLTQIQGGQEIPVTVLFSNYKPVNGVMTPWTIDNTAGPMHMVITMDKVEANVPVDDAMFHMPVKAAAPAAAPAPADKPAETK